MDTKVIRDKQDLTYLNWSHVRSSSGTAGSFLKATDDLKRPKVYYKLSNYDQMNGIIGHECVNEIIADRLLTILGVEHLHYQLIHADILLDGKKTETWLCASEDFKQEGESKQALDAFYEIEKESEDTPLTFCIRNGWGKYIYEMLAVDYIILNRDRHGANIEVLRNSRKRTFRIAPLFDHGLSLLFNCHTEAEVKAFDVMKDRQVQNYIASRSTEENLKLIPQEMMPVFNRLKETDRQVLFEDLNDVLPQLWLDKIWEMVYSRWSRYEDFCHSR